jgi:hypothetical protein
MHGGRLGCSGIYFGVRLDARAFLRRQPRPPGGGHEDAPGVFSGVALRKGRRYNALCSTYPPLPSTRRITYTSCTRDGLRRKESRKRSSNPRTSGKPISASDAYRYRSVDGSFCLSPTLHPLTITPYEPPWQETEKPHFQGVCVKDPLPTTQWRKSLSGYKRRNTIENNRNTPAKLAG